MGTKRVGILEAKLKVIYFCTDGIGIFYHVFSGETLDIPKNNYRTIYTDETLLKA